MDENILSKINRNINILKENDILKKKEAINEIYQIIEQNKIIFKINEFQILFKNIFKTIILGIEDKSDEVREKSSLILYIMIRKCDDITEFYQYIIQCLYERINAYDLEDIQKLPEIMKPHPENKPMKMVKIIETVEEIRMNLLLILGEILYTIEDEYKIKYFDDLINILRTFLMDPWTNILIKACRIAAEFFHNNRELLFNYCEIFGRALLLPLVNKKSKVIVSAINAYRELMYIGCFKNSVYVLEILVGFQDPNSVAIKDFYEPTHHYNYLALLINHPKIQVRETFIETIAEWLTKLPDRDEHAARFLPYLLSGLFDNFDEIKEITLESLEEIGILEERLKEKNFRDAKQFGVDSAWNFNGKVLNLKYIEPLNKRPRLGIRNFFQINISKIIHPILRELKDSINIESRLKSSNLLKYSLLFIEETVITHLDLLFPCLLRNMIVRQNEEIEIKENIEKCLYLIGRYTTCESFQDIIFKIIEFKYSNIENSVLAGIEMLYNLIQGYFEVLPEEKGLFHKFNFLKNILNFFSNKILLNTFEWKEFKILLKIYEFLMDLMNKKLDKDEIIELNKNEYFSYFYLASNSYINFKNQVNSFLNDNKDINKNDIKILDDKKIINLLVNKFIENEINEETYIDDIKFKILYYIITNYFDEINNKSLFINKFFYMMQNDSYFYYISSILINILDIITKMNNTEIIKNLRFHYLNSANFLLNKFYSISYINKDKKFKNYKINIFNPIKIFISKIRELKLDLLFDDNDIINKFIDLNKTIMNILKKEYSQDEKLFYLKVFMIIFQENINSKILLKLKENFIELLNFIFENISTLEYTIDNNSKVGIDALNLIINKILKNEDFYKLFKNEFKKFIDQVVIIYLNIDIIEFQNNLYNLLIKICKNKQLDFSYVIKDAENNNKIKRFDLLKEIWYKIYK